MLKKKRTPIFRLAIIFCFAIVMILCSTCSDGSLPKSKESKNTGINVLLLMEKHYGLNYFLNRDIFEQYGWNVTVAGVSDTIPACPPFAEQIGVPPVIPDILVSQITGVSAYDAIAIMPATQTFSDDPFRDVMDSPEAINLISEAVDKGLAVSAICAGVRVLAAADVLQGKNVVGSPKFQQEYESAGAVFLGNDHPPAIEDNIVTGARDMYYNVHNCQALATVIENNSGKTAHGKTTTTAASLFADFVNYSTGDVDWAKTYGGPGAEGGRSVCATPDGGFFITGYTFAPGSSDPDILAVKTDAGGNIEWSGTFGGLGTEYGNGCTVLEDGYLVTGYTTSYGAGSKDVYLIKIDPEGKEIWSRTYGGSSWDVGMDVCVVEDGYIICGFTHSFGAGEEDVYLIKTDRAGNEVWSRSYGGERSEMGNSVCAAGNGYVIGATTGTYGDGNCNFHMIMTDSEGHETNTHSFGTTGRRGHGFDWCSDLIAVDGGYILAGHTDCQDILDIHVIKTDAEGREIWSKSFGAKPFYDYGNAVAGTHDGGIVVCGTRKSIENNNDIFLTKLDADGNILWEKTFGGPAFDWGSSLCVTEEGDFVILGQTVSEEQGEFDVVLLKVKGN